MSLFFLEANACNNNSDNNNKNYKQMKRIRKNYIS